jgi:S-formylglutathione hydrolase FrmB
MRLHRLGFVLLILIAALPALAQGRAECGTLTSKILHRPVRYCALLPSGFDESANKQRKYRILYYLHGRGDNEQTLITTGSWSLIENLRKQKKLGDFVVVTPQGGNSFYVNSADGKERYSDFFLQEFMPFIEDKYRIERSRESRGLAGFSMGGYGALRFAFAYPELFGSVSAQSAALLDEPPTALNSAIRAGEPQALMMAQVFGNPISAAHWEQTSPFSLAKKNPAAIRKLHIYFDCGDRDDYGFDRGAKMLDQQLTAEHIPHEFHLYPGGHDVPYLLAQISASIEFFSQHLVAPAK